MSDHQQPKKLQTRKSRFLKMLDFWPYTIELYYNKRHKYSSKTTGIISMLFCLISIAVFVINGISFFNQTLSFQENEIKNNFHTMIELERNKLQICLTGHNGWEYFNITNETLEEYGLLVMAEETNLVNGTTTYEQVAMPKQNNNSSWLFTFPQNFNLSLYGRSDVLINQWAEYHRLGLFVLIIDPSKFSKLFNLTVKIIMELKQTNPDQPQFQDQNNSKTRIFYIRDGFPILINQTQQLNLYFRRYEVTTDLSRIFPARVPYINPTPPINYTHFNEQYTTMVTPRQNLDPHDDKKIVWVKIKRSISSVKIDRGYDKIPEFLSNSFSVIGLIYLIFSLLFSGYNKWSFVRNNQKQKHEQNDQNLSNKNEVEQKIQKQQPINIMRYLIHKLKIWSKRGKQIKQNETIVTNFQKDLDIKQILKSIQQLKNQIRVLGIQPNTKKGKKNLLVNSSIASFENLSQPLMQR